MVVIIPQANLNTGRYFIFKQAARMVVETILQVLLSKFLSKLFYGIVKQNIKAEVLKGRFTISNIGLQPNLFIGMNIPFDIFYSYVEKIELIINWRSDERVLILNISNIYGILIPKDYLDLHNVFMKAKQSSIRDFIAEFLKKKSEEEKEKSDAGIYGFVNRLLDNIRISINSVHLRFESEEKQYSIGVKIDRITCNTVNNEGRIEFFNRDKDPNSFVLYKLLVEPLGIYFNSNETNFLCTKNPAEITNEMASMEAHTNIEYSHAFSDKGTWGVNFLKFILSISILGNLRRYIKRDNPEDPKFQCEINFNSVQSIISHEQFHAIMDVVNMVTWYQGKWQQHVAKVELSPYKEKQAREIIALMRKKKNNNKKERQVLKTMARKHLVWVFQQVQVDILKRRFLKQAVKKDITVENLFGNPVIWKIIKKIEIEKMKDWLGMAIPLRQKYKEDAHFFKKKKANLKEFYHSQIDTIKMFKHRLDSHKKEQHEDQHREREVIIKIITRINQINISISKQDMFGVKLEMKDTKASIIKRNNNFILDLGVGDIEASFFSSNLNQKRKTYVPVLARSSIEERQRSKNLLQLRFEKSPLGSPFIFSSTSFEFQSIQVTVYPEVISKLYSIFISEALNIKNKMQKKEKAPKKQGVQERVDHFSSLTSVGLQYNVIEGIVHSPWIVIPLASINDASKECWVLRLGDLNIGTPEHTISKQSNDRHLYYEKYELMLRHFELKYFSSVNFFHTWMSYDMSLEAMRGLPGREKSQIIDVIEPIECFVDLSVLKKHLSAEVRKKKEGIIAKIRINEVLIKLPKLILDKLKNRFDVFEGDKETEEFIETNSANVLQDNTISGIATISYDKFIRTPLFIALKNNYLYFFMKDPSLRNRILSSVDVRTTTIRLTSDHHSFINEGQPKRLDLIIKDSAQHSHWKRSLSQLIGRRDRRYENTYIQSKSGNNFMSEGMISPIQQRETSFQKTINQISESQIYQQEDVERLAGEEKSLFNVRFQMQKMSIQLIDATGKDFLICNFDRTKLTYLNKEEKLMKFSIKEWNILEGDIQQTKDESGSSKQASDQKKKKKTNPSIPFLSCRRLLKEEKGGSNAEGSKQDVNDEYESSFLQLKVIYNEITGDMSDVYIDVDQLYISWDIAIFNKLLKFFFYSSEQGDAPTVSTGEKKPLKIKFTMNRFYLYCFHEEKSLIGLLKLHFLDINYEQSNIEEVYLVNCRKFEMEKYEDYTGRGKTPMIMCWNRLEQEKKKRNMRLSQIKQEDLDDSLMDIDYGNQQPQTDKEERMGQNPMFMSYTVRKQKTQKFSNITKLKKKFGNDLLVSQFSMKWQDAIVFFEQEQTLRLFTYFLNQILGTVASKFKKREYSTNYITQVLKIKKISTINLQISNCIFLLPPHNRNEHFFQIAVDQVLLSKNIRTDNPQYEPRAVSIQTKKDIVQVFYDTMVIEVKNIMPYYRYCNYPSEKVTSEPFTVTVSFSKLGFPREFESVLNSINDIDRTVMTKVDIKPGINLQFQKIIFLTFLKVFYQNIKHRDGLADRFEPPNPNPPLKKYQITINGLLLNMYEFKDTPQDKIVPATVHTTRRKTRASKISIPESKEVVVFQKFTAKQLTISYQNLGTNSDINLCLEELIGSGELPMKKKDSNLPSLLNIQMKSVEGSTSIKVLPQNYEIQVILDNLTNVLDFISYESDYVSNKLMPKKEYQSYQDIGIFPQNCALRMSELYATGQFCISYVKQYKNPVPKEIVKFLLQENEQSENSSVKSKSQRTGKSKKSSQILANSQKEVLKLISDKQITVNGQNLILSISGKHLGEIARLYFSRAEHSAKKTNRRNKTENVMIDGLAIAANVVELSELMKVYDNNIKKSPTFKEKKFFESYYEFPPKTKTIEKRKTEVQFEKSSVNLMRILPIHNSLVSVPPPFESYMSVQFKIPKILYATFQDQQQISIIDLSTGIYQNGQTIQASKIFQCSDFRLHYLQNKTDKSKYIQIENAKNVVINLNTINEKMCALLVKEVTNLSKMKKIVKLSLQGQNPMVRYQSMKINTNRNSTNPTFKRSNSYSKRMPNFTEDYSGEQTYSITFINNCSKKIEITVNHFSFSQDHRVSHERIALNPQQQKAFNLDSVKILLFLNRSDIKSKKSTELAFQLEGHGPIVIKKLEQIWQNEATEIFSMCNLKYSANSKGISFELKQANTIKNATLQPLYFCLFNRNRQVVDSEWTQVDPNQEKHLNSGSGPNFIHLTQSPMRNRAITNPGRLGMIALSEIVTREQCEAGEKPRKKVAAQNRIEPISAYLDVIRWNHQAFSNNIVNLVVFNRIRLQNNLPCAVEANMLTIRPFSESPLQPLSDGMQLEIILRIGDIGQITLNMEELNKMVNKLEEDSSKRQVLSFNLPVPQSPDKMFYRILISMRRGHRGSLPYQKNLEDRLSPQLQQFVCNQQTIMSITSTKVFKCCSYSTYSDGSNLPLRLAFCPDKEKLNKQDIGNLFEKYSIRFYSDTGYAIIPHSTKSIAIQQITRKPTSHKKQHERYLNANFDNKNAEFSESRNKTAVCLLPGADDEPLRLLSGRYTLSAQSVATKAGPDDKQILYVLEDFCTISNDSTFLFEIETEGFTSFLMPGTIQGIPIPMEEQSISIQIAAFSLKKPTNQKVPTINQRDSIKQGGFKHLRSTTKIRLNSFKPTSTFYWAINPITPNTQHLNSYDSALIRVTIDLHRHDIDSDISSAVGIKKYQILLEEVDSAKFGYQFTNMLSQNYTMIVREEQGHQSQQLSDPNDLLKSKLQQIEWERDQRNSGLEESEQEAPFIHMKQMNLNQSEIRMSPEPSYPSQRDKNHLQFSRSLRESSFNFKEYIVRGNGGTCTIGLTNLGQSVRNPKSFTIELYRNDKNTDYADVYRITVDNLDKQPMRVQLKEPVEPKLFHLINVDQEDEIMGSSVYNRDSLLSSNLNEGSVRRKLFGRGNTSQSEGLMAVLIHTHKRPDNSFQVIVTPADPGAIATIAAPERLQLRFFEMAVTLKVPQSKKPLRKFIDKDTTLNSITLELQNLKFIRVKKGPSAHSQDITLKLSKLLIREDESEPILQMLHPERQFVDFKASIQKVGSGSKINSLRVNLLPFELFLREGIIFNILSLFEEMREHYAGYGIRYDRVLDNTSLGPNLQNSGKKYSSSLPPQGQEPALMRKNTSTISNTIKPEEGSEYKLYSNYRKKQQENFKRLCSKNATNILIVDELQSSATNVYLSYLKDEYSSHYSQFSQDPIIKYLILLPAIRELKIAMPRLDVKNFEGPSKDFGKLILKEVKQNLGQTVLSSFSSLSLFDGPGAAIDGITRYLEVLFILKSS